VILEKVTRRLYFILAISSCFLANSWIRLSENTPTVPILLVATSFGLLVFISNPYENASRTLIMFSGVLFFIVLISASSNIQDEKWRLFEWAVALSLLPALRSVQSRVAWFTPIQFVYWNASSLAVFSQALNIDVFYSFQANLFNWTPNIWVNEWGFQRFKGGLGDYELLAEIMVLGITASLFWILGTGWKLHLLLSLMFMTVTLFQTGTRSSLLLLVSALVLTFSGKGKALKRFFVPLASMLILLQFFPISATSTLIVRLQELDFFAGDFSANINRKQVWEIYSSRLDSGANLFGNGPTFPFEKFGLYPHSLLNSFLYLFGILGTIVFFAFLLATLFTAARSKSKFQSFELTFLLIFLVDQIKIEFTRLGNYSVFILICLGLIYTLGGANVRTKF
jgi:hypothetical protein